MLRFILRTLGFILLAAAFAALIVDGTRSIAAKDIIPGAFGDTLVWLTPARTTALKNAIDHIGIEPLRTLAAAILAMPTALVLGIAGGVLMFAGRVPRPAIGTSSRA